MKNRIFEYIHSLGIEKCGVAHYGGKSAICEAAHKIIALEVFKDHFRTTLNCGLISGGTAENTVPSKCTFTADVRFVDQAGMEEADRFVREVAAKSYLGGTTCDVEVASRRSPMERCARNDELLEKTNAAYAAAGFDPLTGRSSNGGSDAADVTACIFRSAKQWVTWNM